MATGRPPLGTVIEQADGSHQIFDGKNFVPAQQSGDGQWSVDAAEQSRMGVGSTGPSQKLTEDQGKAQTYGRLMSHAETSYEKARDEGYNPADLRNSTASFLEGLPFGGLDGAARAVRDDVGDRGRQAEMEWSDAQLKAVSGAASPEAEVKRNVATYFPRPFEGGINDQKAEARRTAFDAAKVRAGPAGEAIGPYVKGGKPITPELIASWTAPQKAALAKYKGAVGTPGTAKNPFVAGDAEFAGLPSKAYFIAPDGSLRRKP